MASAAGGDRDASCTNDPNFAVICVFLEKFGQLCGLEYPNFINLQNFIENTDEVPPELLDLLVKLLRKNRYTVHPELWERALVKFCHTYSNQDAWEVERFGYKKSRLPVKLNVLKSLLESQFDRNGKLRTAVGSMKAADMRSHPIGRDKFGNAYWSTIDNKACLIRIYQEHLDEETWQIVASNRDEFAKLIQGLKSDKPVTPSLSVCDEDSSSNSVNNEKTSESSTVKNGDTSKVVVMGNGNDGEKENIILKITKNRIEVSDVDEEMDDEEEEEDEEDYEGELSKEEIAAETKTEDKSEPQQQLRPSLLASKPPSKKPLAHPKKRANEIENETDSKKPKERLTLLGQQHKDKNKSENENIDEEEFDEEEEYSDEDELEEEEVEEEEDEEEEGFEGEEDPEVSEPIEDPVVKVSGEGNGVDNKGTFLEFTSSINDEFSEVIEEDIMYFYGEGSGNACQVGNLKEGISESESKVDLIGRTESLKDEPASSKPQTIEAKKVRTPSDKTTKNEAESHQNNLSSNSCVTTGLSNSKSDVTEPPEINNESENDCKLESTSGLTKEKDSIAEIDTTNDNPLVETISETCLENKETCSTDKDNLYPVVGKNNPPERDKKIMQSKPLDEFNEDKVDPENKKKIPSLEMAESANTCKKDKIDIGNRSKTPPEEMAEPLGNINETTRSVTVENDAKVATKSGLEVDGSKISNGAKHQVDQLKDVDLTSSASNFKPLVQTEDELIIREDKVIIETSKSSIIGSLSDKTIGEKKGSIEIPNLTENNPEVKKLIVTKFEDAKPTSSKVESHSFDSKENIEVLSKEQIKVPTKDEVEIKAITTICSKIEISIVKQPEELETAKVEKSTINDSEKIVEMFKEKITTKIESEKASIIFRKHKDSSVVKSGFITAILPKTKKSTNPESEKMVAVPPKDVQTLVSAEKQEKVTSSLLKSSISASVETFEEATTSLKLKETTDVVPKNENLLHSKAKESSDLECAQVILTPSKTKLPENVNSPNAKEEMTDESEMVSPPKRATVENVVVTSARIKETIITEPNKIITSSKIHKLEDASIAKADKLSEEEKSLTKSFKELSSAKVPRPSGTSITKVIKPISTNAEKSSTQNCTLEEPQNSPKAVKPSIAGFKEKDDDLIESKQPASKTKLDKSITEKDLAGSSEPSMELNGIASSEPDIEDASTKVQLNQITKISESECNDNTNTVPEPYSKTITSTDIESVKEEEKGVNTDEVPEPQTPNPREEIKIPEIKITEVEHLSKDELGTKNKIEPNHLKAPEIDTKDCNAKMISDAKDAPKNVQSFSLDFNEEDEEDSLKLETTLGNTPAKRGRKPKAQKIPKDPLELDDTESESKSKTIKKRGGARKKRNDVEPALIIKEDENETPVRQSRRIAQLKIREEAERRKLEEMVLKQMKESSDRKKKEEEKKKNPDAVDSDPDADIEQSEEEEEEESDSGSEKKILKKPKKKKKKKKDGSQPWQTSSGSSDSEDNDEELDILEHEEDEELPPLKSDHEFSPESDMEDETQVEPMKRARTVKKDKPQEAEEEEDDTDENPEHACQKCGKHDHPEWILLCDTCDKGYHCSCLTPVLFIIPEGDWYCPPCQHQKLINIFTVQLEEFDEMIKQKELEENRKRRMIYTNVSAQNVLPISKKEPRARGRKKNHNRARVPRRRKRSTDDDDEDDEKDDDPRNRRKSSLTSSSSSSSSSSSGDSENSSDDEPIYKLRKRRQAAVSYRFNEFDDLINSAIKEEMDEVKGAGNLGRGKDISTIIEADKEEKRLKEQDVNHTDVKEEGTNIDDKNVKDVVAEPKTDDMDLEEPESKKILNEDDLLKEEDEQKNSDAETETSDIIRRPSIIKRSSNSGNRKGRKKSRKLNSLDVESDDDGSDEDFKGSSSDSEDEEEVSVSSASESSLENKWSKKRKKNKSGGRRLRQRRRRVEAFINDNSDDSDEIKRPVRKRKKKEESDFSDFDDDDDEEEDIDSEDLCDTSTDSGSNSDGAWKPKNKRRKTSIRKQTAVQKRPAIMIHRKKTKKLDDDEKSFKVGMTKKKVMAKPDSDESDDESKARKTRGRKITYLEDFDDSSDDGIRPGVKRPDTPPEERALFIKKQEEIKRMLAAKNTDAAKVMATPVLKPLKSTIEEPLISDSISTVPKQIIQNAKVLDPDFLKNKQNNEFDEEFDDQLPEDFDPEEMDEEEIAKMMEEEDFAQQQLKLAGEAIRNKKLKEAELNRKKEFEKTKQSHLLPEKSMPESIILPITSPAESIGSTPLLHLQTIQPSITSAPMMPQTRPMHHPPSSILSHGNPLPPGMHPSHMPPGPSQMPNMIMPSLSDTMRLLRPDFDMKKRNRKSILDLGLPRPTGYQATHIPSQMPSLLQQQMMSRPPVAHLPSMAHLPPSAHMPPGPQGPRAFQMQRHLPPHIMNQIPPAHTMHSNPVRMAPPNVTVLPPNIPPNIIPNPIPNANEPIIPTTVLSVANQKPTMPPASIPSISHSTSVINSLIPPPSSRNPSNPIIPQTQPTAEALNAASQSELDALKRRGRRKKITPLRDPSKPNPGLADLSQAHGAPVPKSSEAHNAQVEKKSNPILVERLTSSPAGGILESPVKSVLVGPPNQIFPPRASATASVITRIQQPPRPHQTPPFPQASSRYFAPPIPRPPHHPLRPPFSGNPPPGMPPVTEPGPHYLTSDSRQPGGGHMFRPSMLHGFTGPSNPLHPLQIPSTQAHLVRGPTPPRDYSGGPTLPPPSFLTPTSQYGDFYPSPNQAVPAIPAERHQQSSPEQPPSFDQYEPLKSIPVTVAENASQFETTNDDDTRGDGSQDGADPGDTTGLDGNSNSGPTSEFSGLVSYFSSQQDDLDT